MASSTHFPPALPLRALLAGFGSILLAACGGGGGSSSAPPLPTVSLSLATGATELSAYAGDALPLTVKGNWSGSNLGQNQVYIRVRGQQSSLVSPKTVTAGVDGSFEVALATNHQLVAGEYSATLVVDACMDANCTSIYSNSSKQLSLQLAVTDVPPWSTHQGNPHHNGYVPIWVDTSGIRLLWQWDRESASGETGAIHPPAAAGGEVYVANEVYFREGILFALDDLSGQEHWRLSFGTDVPALNPPAISGEQVYISTSGHEDTKLWSVSRADGSISFQANFSSQWGHYLAPTVMDGVVYQSGGYYGGHVYAFAADNGSSVWENSSAGSWGDDTPAVDGSKVYVHNLRGLSVIDKESGKTLREIEDPMPSGWYEFNGSVVIGSEESVLAFSGDPFWPRQISRFNIANDSVDWTSTSTYGGDFAVAEGVVYAGNTNPVALDALDEESGELLWRWTPPSTEDTAISDNNIVVTRNLVFVTTNANLYAVDLQSRKVVWSYKGTGEIAISDNRILLLTPTQGELVGTLLAFDLRKH